MRKLASIAGIGAFVVIGTAAAAPASATNVTFTLETGLLGITQPAAEATLTGAALSTTGATFTGALGTTVVDDKRGGTLGWTSKIAGSSFTNGTTTIPVDRVKAFVPGVITPTGVVTATAGTYLTAGTGLTLSGTAQTLVTATAVVGENSVSFVPHLSVSVPSDATGGKYTGTVTQTVS